MKIKAKKITAENFSSFGKALVEATGDPTSQAVDYKFWSDIINYNIEGDTEIGICTVYKQQLLKINDIIIRLKFSYLLMVRLCYLC